MIQLLSLQHVEPFETLWNSCLELLIQTSVGLLWTLEMLTGRDLQRPSGPA